MLLEYWANDWDQVTTKSIEGSGRPSRAQKEVCVGPIIYPGRAHTEGAESGDAVSIGPVSLSYGSLSLHIRFPTLTRTQGADASATQMAPEAWMKVWFLLCEVEMSE